MPGDGPLDTLSLEDLRQQRIAARRAAEFGHLRARQGDGSMDPALEDLDARVKALTEELIARYAADLTLVDSLLDPAYPAEGARGTAAAGGGTHGGRGR